MIKKIPIDGLKPGTYVCGIDKGGPGNVFFFANSILIRDEHEARRFRENGCKSVYVETDDEPDLLSPPARAPSGLEPYIGGAADMERCPEASLDGAQSGDKTAFKDELKEARLVRREAEDAVKEFMASVQRGGIRDTGRLSAAVEAVNKSVLRNQWALPSLARLKSFDGYTFTHSVNVCILSAALGRQMGASEAELQDLGLGSILHDVGKMMVPEHILNKPGALTPEEFGEVKRHSLYGAEELQKNGGVPQASIDVVVHHHEKCDGTGYPSSRSGHEIPLFARIAAVADVYDAMTTMRVYRKALLPNEALQKMYLMRRSHLDPEVVERLISLLGVYPAGSVVELNTGEVGVVRMVNKSHPVQPLVLLLLSKERKPYARPFEADLRDHPGRWIVGAKSPEAVGGNIEEFML